MVVPQTSSFLNEAMRELDRAFKFSLLNLLFSLNAHSLL